MGHPEFALHTDDPDRPYEPLGPVRARVGAATVFSKAPTLEDVNFRIQEEAVKLGANGVVGVSYKRGMSAGSWKSLSALGTAVRFGDDTKTCPHCAETIKAAAVKCRFCGEQLAA